jgi:hypothetical protein
MLIRPLKPNEASMFRAVHPRTLADAPHAFGETLQQARSQPGAYWQNLTESVTQPSGQVMILAEDNHQVMGFALGQDLENKEITTSHPLTGEA